MKKVVFLMLCAFILSVATPVTVKAVSQGDFCDPKKMEQCQSKIDNLLVSIDALRAKLIKAKQEMSGGKKLTNEQADRMLQRMDAIQKNIPPVVTNDSGNIYDY
jgi:hypothetical protein